MNKTLIAFLSDSNLTKRLAKEIINNMTEKQENEMVFNLTQAEFDFTNEIVNISYFVKDFDYPEIALSFNELKNMLTQKEWLK